MRYFAGGIRSALGIFLGALIAGTLACCLIFGWAPLSTKIDNMIFDIWMTSGSMQPAPANVAIVDIDEASIRKIGQLPWSRSILGDLVSLLLANGVSAIGLDIWLTEPDRSSPVVVDSLLEKNFGLNLDFTNISPAALDNDRYFRNIIKDKPVILGAFASFDDAKGSRQECFLYDPPEEIIDQSGQADVSHVRDAGSVIPPLPLFTAVAPVGILSLLTDPDGIVRNMPLLSQSDGRLYPDLTLRTLMAALGEKIIRLKSNEDGILEAIQLGEKEIPVNADASFRISYRGPDHSVPYYSALDVMEGRAGNEELEGKIVFVGNSAHSMLNLHSTPFDPEVPGAEIHATVVDNILSGRQLLLPAHQTALIICLTYLCAFIAAIAFFRFALPFYTVTALGIIALLFAISWYLFQQRMLFSPAGPIFALFFAGILILPFRYWHEQSERRRLRLAFGRYVSPGIVAKIIAAGDELLKGEQKEATILFTDIRSFTGIAERLSPSQLVSLLNRYFTPMTSCVRRYNGTLDKFIGDALMAFWNAPLDVPDHAAQAVKAALAMQDALTRLKPELEKDFSVDINMGVGINSGSVYVGNMGSDDLLDYTCIGETVNVASRLEGLCKYYGLNIITSESVVSACGPDIFFLLLDRISIKGSTKPVRIYYPIYDGQRPAPLLLEQWEEALTTYFEGDYKMAEKEFGRLKNDSLFRGPAELFLRRCAYFSANPPQVWTGVWNFKSK